MRLLPSRLQLVLECRLGPGGLATPGALGLGVMRAHLVLECRSGSPSTGSLCEPPRGGYIVAGPSELCIGASLSENAFFALHAWSLRRRPAANDDVSDASAQRPNIVPPVGCVSPRSPRPRALYIIDLAFG